MNLFFEKYIQRFSFVSILVLKVALSFSQSPKFDSVSYGVLLKGDIKIFDEADLLITGCDLILDSANVLGQGKVILKNSEKQYILSTKSKVNHLLIHTPTSVQLLGDLQINKSLSVYIGIFDVSEAKLTMGGNSTLSLINGGKIIHHKHSKYLSSRPIHHKIPTFSTDAVFLSHPLENILYRLVIRPFLPYDILLHPDPSENIEIPPKI